MAMSMRYLSGVGEEDSSLAIRRGVYHGGKGRKMDVYDLVRNMTNGAVEIWRYQFPLR